MSFCTSDAENCLLLMGYKYKRDFQEIEKYHLTGFKTLERANVFEIKKFLKLLRHF